MNHYPPFGALPPQIAALNQLSRRGLVRMGLGGWMGLSLGSLLRAKDAASALPPAPPPALPGQKPAIRSCILIFLYGGPSHIDTFDPKPDAPAEIRGEFRTTATSVPGTRFTEHLPQLAKIAHKFAVIRSVHHAARLHDSASIHALTGRALDGPDRELFAPLPQIYPAFGSAVSRFAFAKKKVPFASLPFVYNNVVPTPSQGGGLLGTDWDPLRIEVDPENRSYRVELGGRDSELGPERRTGRRALLETIAHVEKGPQGKHYRRAFELMQSDEIRRAIDLSEEPESVRERYGFFAPPDPSGTAAALGVGRQMRGQNLLLARRLVEAGVPFVNVYDFKQQGQNWDAHADGFRQHRDYLLPFADRSISALIEDLEVRGLLDSTLVVVTGEFGRTPRINATAGRDHWPDCYSVLMAGGGIRGGAIYGTSDKQGAYPASFPVTPGDIAATIFQRFGINPLTEIHDPLGRPFPLAGGEPLPGLFV